MNIEDELPIWVSVEEQSFCDCCKYKHMKRVFVIRSTFMDDFTLGYICAGRWFNINLSGNISKARRKFQNKLNGMPKAEVFAIVDKIFAEDVKAMGDE